MADMFSGVPGFVRWLRTVDDQLHDVVERDRRDPDEVFRRRQLRSALVLTAGAVGLALSLRMDHNSPWFPAAALGVAAIWALGALWAGPLHLGHIRASDGVRRPIAEPIALGIALALLFAAGAFVTRYVPPLAEQVRDVLSFAESGSLLLLTITTLLSGIAEELFFRGALYAAIPRPHQVLITTALYAVTTVLTGNIMLAFAAAFLGTITGLQRRATGGVLAPILTHVVWSMAMLHVLPHIL